MVYRMEKFGSKLKKLEAGMYEMHTGELLQIDEKGALKKMKKDKNV